MNIYVAFNPDGEPTSVLLAEDRKSADIAWAGMKECPHSVEEIDPTSKDIGVHGVAFLLTSKLKNSYDVNKRGGWDFRVWKRGL